MTLFDRPVLVVGGCGFIGSHLVDALRAQDLQVRVFDRAPELFREPLPDVDYRYGDMLDQEAVAAAMAGVGSMCHLVSTTFPASSNENPVRDVEQNLVGSLKLFTLAKEHGVGRILFLSSGGAVYGPPETIPISESHPLRPLNSYGIVKIALERYLDLLQAQGGFSSVVIRPSNPYGPRQGHTGTQGVVSTFLRRMRRDEPIEVWGDGSVVRDYLHVADLAQLCVKALLSDQSGAYNAGSGEGVSLRDLIALLGDATGKKPDIVWRPGRPVDVPISVLDCSRARDAFDWTVSTPLQTGVLQLWRWLEKNG